MRIPSRRAFVAAATWGSTWLSLTAPAYDSAILGGFLLPETGYDPYVIELRRNGYNPKFFAYNDPELLDNEELLIFPSTRLLVGHSKGAKTIAKWMASCLRTRPIPCVLIEPVDVDPPRQPHFSVLELWNSNLDSIASIPTLIVSAPYTQTSKRYGKAANLCAPEGKDATAFFSTASKARQAAKVSAPLAFVQFPTLGHNDVTSAMLGGCGNGDDRKVGALAVSKIVSSWLETLNTGGNFADALERVDPVIPFRMMQ